MATKERSTTMITSAEAAIRLGVDVAQLRRWRETGDGPGWLSIGPKLIRYDPTDLDDWETENASHV